MSDAYLIRRGGKPEEEKTVTAGTSAVTVNPTTGKTLKKVTVNPTPTESKTVTPAKTQQVVTPSTGKHLSSVTVAAMEQQTASEVSYNNSKSGIKATTVQDAIDELDRILTGTFRASGWSSTISNGWYTNQINVVGMTANDNPFLDLVITNATTATDEREAFNCIMECETFDGYVIAKAIDKPTIDINVRFSGV